MAEPDYTTAIRHPSGKWVAVLMRWDPRSGAYQVVHESQPVVKLQARHTAMQWAATYKTECRL